VASNGGQATFSLMVRPEESHVLEDLAGQKDRSKYRGGGGDFCSFVHELLKTNGIDHAKGVQYVNIPGAMPKSGSVRERSDRGGRTTCSAGRL